MNNIINSKLSNSAQVIALTSLIFFQGLGSTSFASDAKLNESDNEIVTDSIIVAGGCFWCVESDYEKFPGVIEAVSGYTGGYTENPTYKDVTSKPTGHYEAVEITFDTSKTSAKELIEYFWLTIDPTDDRGQFCDKGPSYKTALFYQNEEQQQVFSESLENLKQNKPFKDDIVTPILPAKKFYVAEKYHQDFYKKSPIRYNYYRKGCGRDARIKQLYGKVASKDLSS